MRKVIPILVMIFPLTACSDIQTVTVERPKPSLPYVEMTENSTCYYR